MNNILSGRRVEVFGNETDETTDEFIKLYDGTFIEFSRDCDGYPVAIVMDDEGALKYHCTRDVKIADPEHLLCAIASQQMP